MPPMKKLTLTTMAAACALGARAEWAPGDWPVMKSYDGDHLYRISLPMGGIGTGVVGLGGRGELRDWEIMNVPAKGYSTVVTGSDAPFFAIWTKNPKTGETCTRLLAGPIYPYEISHWEGRPVDHHGFPRFRRASFDAAYPFGQAHLSGGAPVSVTVKGFNPLVPGDSEASSLPVAVISYEVSNPGGDPLEVAVAGAIKNFIGKDGSRRSVSLFGSGPVGARTNRNAFVSANGLRGISFTSDGVDRRDPAWGTMALVTEAENVSHRTNSAGTGWNLVTLDFWDDFSADGVLSERPPSGADDPMAALAAKKTIPPHGKANFTFYLVWSFPNRFAWSEEVVGNWYAKRYPDAWRAAQEIVPRIPALERRTKRFVETFAAATLPACVKEAALFNLNALRSQTTFRLPSGHLMGWEGTSDTMGSCHGSCTHVWNYEQATAFLFADLARTMRDVEFNYATDAKGRMSFRANLPLEKNARQYDEAAADGQLGCVMKAYREWQLSGDTAWLKRLWPNVRRALAYAWDPEAAKTEKYTKGGWDADRDGAMEGCQHNTMDVNYYGPNPQMQFWYLGALRAAAKMARACGDEPFARTCDEIFAKGTAFVDQELFNGEYYEHRIALQNGKIPDYQLGSGCLVDQLVGQMFAHVVGLGDLARPENLRAASSAVMRHNFRWDVYGHFNNMRSYVFPGERALLMAAWPKGRLAVPFPYFPEAMTGFEYAAAAEMAWEGDAANATLVVQSVRDRFDGLKRNPFDEPECGHHYARSMTSWAVALALSGFHYSGVDRTMSFTAEPGRYFWSTGAAWGSFELGLDEARLTVEEGALDLRAVRLDGRAAPVLKDVKLAAGQSAAARYEPTEAKLLPVIPQPAQWRPAGGTCAKGAALRETLVAADARIAGEGYELAVRADGAEAKAATPAGLFWARQTWAQLVRNCPDGVPCGTVLDRPKYRVRGVMLDVARKWFPMSWLREVAKNMAHYKMNELHLHLNDDSWSSDPNGLDCYSAFRLESERFPGLAAKDGHYTKAEFRAFCKDCAAMGVTVVPEFDAPAHSGCFTALKPEFASDRYGRQHLDLHNPAVLAFFDELLGEYLDGADPVFPGPYMHVGTDEYNKNEAEAFRAFTDAMFRLVRKHGKEPRAWGALTHAKGETPVLADPKIVMDIWHNPYYQPLEALKAGYSIVAIPDFNLYVVPAAGYYCDYLDLPSIFGKWEPCDVAGVKIPADHPQLLGGSFAIWNDLAGNGVSADDVCDRLFGAMQVLAQQTWSGSVPGQRYAQFAALAARTGEPEGVNAADRVELDAQGRVKPGQKAIGWTQDGGWTVEFDLTLDGGQPKDATAFDDGFTQVKVNQGNSGHLGFSRDGYDFTFNWYVSQKELHHVKLSGDPKGVSLWADGRFRQRLEGGRRTFRNSAATTPLLQTMHFPLVQTPDRFRGKIENFTVRTGAEK